MIVENWIIPNVSLCVTFEASAIHNETLEILEKKWKWLKIEILINGN